MSDKINEFLESIPDGRCKGCRYAKTVFATNQYMFLGCYCVPYRVKQPLGGGRPARCRVVRVHEFTGSTPASARCKTWHNKHLEVE